MSGPDQVQDTEADPGYQHKEIQQSESRIRVASLLCSIEAAEPFKSAPWESPRTEAVHLEGLSQPRSSQSPLQRSPTKPWRTTHDRHLGDYEYSRPSEARLYYDRPFSTDPAPTPGTHMPSQANQYSQHDTQQRFCSPTSTTSHHHDSLPSLHSTPSTPHSHDHRRFQQAPERRDSALGRRDIDTRDSSNPSQERIYSSFNRDLLHRHPTGEYKSPFSTPPSTSSAGGYFAPRPASSAQRSASMHVDYNQDHLHPYDVDQLSRTVRSKSDFALHQQNYGPYLDQSPSMEPAPLFQPRKASIPSPVQEKPRHYGPPTPQSAPLYSNAPSYFYDQAQSFSHLEQVRPPYTPGHAPKRSIQVDSRRPSQGYILPPPEVLHAHNEVRKSTRIYGLDAADTPSRPPLAPSASYDSKPLQDIPDDVEEEYPHRPSRLHVVDSGYRSQREAPPPRYSHTYENRPSPSSPLAAGSNNRNTRYQTSVIDRPPYDHSPRDDMSFATTQQQPDSRPYSPGVDIQPPRWYQQYANAVPHKPQLPSQLQSRPSFSQGDSRSNASPARRGSDYTPSRHVIPRPDRSQEEQPSSESSFSAAVPHSNHEQGYGQSKPLQSRARSSIATSSPLSTTTAAASASHSVHPFDIPVAESPSSSVVSKAGDKRDRSQQEQEDPFAPEDGVKAKRKRANAEQLSVLNAAFERSYFPSTEERLRLSKQTKMCPRTVQIWFQNKRQSVKARTEAMDAAVAAVNGSSGLSAAGRRRGSQAQSQAQERSRAEAELEERQMRRRSHGGDHKDSTAPYYQQQQQTQQHLHQRQQQEPHPYPQTYSPQQYPPSYSVQYSQQQQRHSPPRQSAPSYASEKRRNSGPLTPSDPVLASLHIQLDSRDVDYFSRKRRATVAQMEHNKH
ncbi:hypothetical protein EDD11_001888 [Mortierella claussenii]|nr:hypothetical protein EDD11_001888 [Mortierella claussenii]